ncbi:Retrovirus-related Pol polyprotein from transposon RE1 [Linum perenne]
MTTSMPIEGLLITLPTGQQVRATHIGTVQIADDLTLHNVLHVPDFTFNLISVSKLTSQKPLSLIFYSTHCDLQNTMRGTMIGSAKLCKELYQWKSCKPVSHVASAHSQQVFYLWHHRLGHVSHSKTPLLKQLFPAIETFGSVPCDTCLMTLDLT